MRMQKPDKLPGCRKTSIYCFCIQCILPIYVYIRPAQCYNQENMTIRKAVTFPATFRAVPLTEPVPQLPAGAFTLLRDPIVHALQSVKESSGVGFPGIIG